jgi:hypothetical protein
MHVCEKSAKYFLDNRFNPTITFPMDIQATHKTTTALSIDGRTGCRLSLFADFVTAAIRTHDGITH